MAYNTKPIITDKDGNPISQYYNPSTDKYEPVEGFNGANKVIVYKSDGTENNELSLIQILDKLSQLTGTVIDEETRKSNELQRIELYNQISQMLATGQLKGDKGDIGLGLQFDWLGTSLGVRVEGDTDYVYVDLRGPKGDKGDTGVIENLNAQHIEDALGYVPADEDIIGMLSELTTNEKANLVQAINEVKSQSNQMATKSEINATNLRVDNLVIPISPENVNVEVTDAHNSIIKNKNYASLKDRFEEGERELIQHKLDYNDYLAKELGTDHLIREMPNGIKDEIDNRQKIKKIGFKIFNGGEFWELQSINGYDIANFYLSKANLVNILPDIAKISNCIYTEQFTNQTSVIATTTTEGIYYNTTDLYIRISASKLTTRNVVGFKAWLQNNPISLMYQLGTPQVVSLYPANMTPNTHEIVRNSIEINNLYNLIKNVFIDENALWEEI